MKSQRVHRAACIGELLWDVFPDHESLGGAPTNVAFHLNQLGYTSSIVSAVGSDELGKRAIQQLTKKGLDTTYIGQNAQAETGYVSVTLDQKGTPAFRIHTDVAWDAIGWTNQLSQLSKEVDVVVFGSLAQRSKQSRLTIQRFVEESSASWKVFDINLRQTYWTSEVIRRSLALATVLKVSDAEWKTMCNCAGIGDAASPDNVEDAIRQSHTIMDRFNLDYLCLTRGPQGALVVDTVRGIVSPATDDTPVDTVGAGDAFTAAMLYHLLEDGTLEDIGRAANILGGYLATQRGAMPKVPDQIIASVQSPAASD